MKPDKILLFFIAIFPAISSANFPSTLFGFQQEQQKDINVFLQWVRVLENHIKLDIPEGSCDDKKFNRCHFRNWQGFLDEIRELSPDKQLIKVNQYANNKEYILDIDNYGMSDYWAVAKEFLYNGGDCEDYAIIKLFSLRWLGFPIDSTRIVVLQDTNLRVAHAVLAVANKDDIMILDNQIEEVVSHQDIVHYSPVYSINENHWWLHLPN